jgi:hypothetical protein
VSHEDVLDGEDAGDAVHIVVVDGEAGEWGIGVEGEEVGDGGALRLARDLGVGVSPASLVKEETIQERTMTKGVKSQAMSSRGRA